MTICCSVHQTWYEETSEYIKQCLIAGIHRRRNAIRTPLLQARTHCAMSRRKKTVVLQIISAIKVRALGMAQKEPQT